MGFALPEATEISKSLIILRVTQWKSTGLAVSFMAIRIGAPSYAKLMLYWPNV